MECPHCGAPLAASYLRAGRRRGCPVCGGDLLPPRDGAVPAAAPEASPEPETAPPAWAPGATEADLSAPAFVCIAEERKVNPLAVGPLIERFTGMSRADARHHAARGRGLVAEGLSLDTARNLVEALREEGIEAFALPAARVPGEVEEVRIVRVYSAEADALHLETDAEGTVKAVPWPRVVAGVCTQAQFPGRRTVEVHVDRPIPMATAGMGAVWVPDTEAIRVQRPARPRVRVTLVLAGRAGTARTVSFDERQVRYAYLGERIRPTQRLNLGRLLDDVIAHCPRGFFPPGFRAAATGTAVRVPRMVGKLDYGHYVQWAICCAAARDLFRTGSAGR